MPLYQNGLSLEEFRTYDQSRMFGLCRSMHVGIFFGCLACWYVYSLDILYVGNILWISMSYSSLLTL